MCANPKMQRLLLAELKDELAARRAARLDGARPRKTGLAWGMLAAAMCLAFLIVL